MNSTSRDFPRYIASSEAARRLDMTPWTYRKLAKQGKVPGIQIGNRWKVLEVEFEEWRKVGGDWRQVGPEIRKRLGG